ncbi:BTB/POZ domain-containing protein At5g03250 [Lactuca sativa]|uniref:NPH3 domain-containing protein n=1 Tax=Lactuca sativa TaxID=4236 RepID=A0A9R1WBE5_LACSA|nr:BTB/POZ domain-containing protein At5g03250 [Lactuca sativa]KAJ0222005.1 hypothetical protein LSAT_V11C200091930 [Lactuca sativa]
MAMACMKLGSKSEVFHLDQDEKTWTCSSGLPSDVTIEVGDISFHLHKFPLLSRSKTLENLIGDSSDDEKKMNFGDEKRSCVVKLHDLPGGPKIFLLVAKFCYGVKLELNSNNVVHLRCASEYLQMTEEYGDENLISQTENFLNEVFDNWNDTLKALESCEEVVEYAEDLQIVSRCIDSLALKACSSDKDLLGWPVSSMRENPFATVIWNGIQTSSSPNQDWWYEDVSGLKLPLYRRFILAIESTSLDQERIAGSLMFYAKKHLPLLGRQSMIPNVNLSSFDSYLDQKTLLEEIVDLLPSQKGVVPTKLLLRLLKTAMILHCSPLCLENLERRVGLQMDQASIEDILIPNMGYSSETLYEIDCVQRMLDHFMVADRDRDQDGSEITDSGCLEDNDDDLIRNSHSLTPVTMVANLIDNYLAEVASDVNLKLEKFQSLAATVPDFARSIDDGMYRAIDIYLKAHPWLTDSDRELLCRLMDCQKLSLEASTHAAQNERLPLRFIVQVLFFEQLRLRTSVAGCLYVSDNYNSQTHLSSSMVLPESENVHLLTTGGSDRRVVAVDDMRGRVSELEKECLSMKKEIDKIVKSKGINWNSLCKMFGVSLRLKSKSRDRGGKNVSPASRIKENNQNEENGELNRVE